MTYAQLLLVFVVMPTVALSVAVLVVRQRKRGQKAPEPLWPRLAPVLALMGVATLYTIPWDNHLIALGVWWYRPTLLLGLSIDHIPLEEALFFPLQTLLVGMWWIWLTEWTALAHGAVAQHDKQVDMGERRSPSGRITLFAAGSAVWLGALTFLGAGWRPGTYVGWETVWALPPLLLQILVGGDILWRRRHVVGWVVAPTALYLSGVDALAIHLGIWTIDPRQSLDLLIGGQLPIEELLFFLATSALIGFGVVLGVAVETRLRARAVWQAMIALAEPDTIARHRVRTPVTSPRRLLPEERRDHDACAASTSAQTPWLKEHGDEFI